MYRLGSRWRSRRRRSDRSIGPCNRPTERTRIRAWDRQETLASRMNCVAWVCCAPPPVAACLLRTPRKIRPVGPRGTPREVPGRDARTGDVIYGHARPETRVRSTRLGNCQWDWIYQDLRSTTRNRELRGTTESFGAMDGARRRQSRKTTDLVKIVTINQIWPT